MGRTLFVVGHSPFPHLTPWISHLCAQGLPASHCVPWEEFRPELLETVQDAAIVVNAF